MAAYGLPVRSITIKPADMAELLHNVWSDRFVPVKLTIDGETVQAEARIRGGHTRNYLKKSYEIRYGNRTLHMNTEFDDPSMIRNALSFHFFNQIGVPAPATKHVWLEWNGEPHGVYLEIEAVDQLFFKKRRIQAASLVYAINDNADFSLLDQETKQSKSTLFSGYQLMKGTDSVKKQLGQFISTVNRPATKVLRTYLSKRLDINQYLRWLAGAVLTNNYDGFDQNYALYVHSPTNRYRIIPWDYEGTWGRNCYGRLCESDLVPVRGMNKLTGKLMKYRSIRVRYRSLLKELLADAFTIERIEPVAKQMMTQIDPAIRDDFTRKWPYGTFQEELDVIRTFIQERRAIVQSELTKWKD
ncbi:spore coat protein H [Paenibacillus phyllosphaerae]|uniref:Spore coat protein H n=1 Tax=Paenibacillus phyllosphaerae TaxID=274593 RepID=A0A7W5B4R0_9BACL|nr:CotH kinase family protein [Paenibacillus phyllosphaerae]MBB3114338.1 spore coat protein H [Paenibacillus phyllosphaerae]